ncbi:MAG: hypothetical protein KA022_00655 [Candidatus Omnitrophica bacterium]|nr:hypothetical protein [Candidatus Omnitrophota bacterium]
MELNKDKKNPPVLEYTILAAIIIAASLFIFQVARGDIDTARAIFKDLTNGRYSVQRHIGWEQLKGLDINVGATYSSFATGKEKNGYKKAFIRHFSSGFKSFGGDYKSFVNWRIDSKAANQVVVAADYSGHNRTLLLTLSGTWRKKLSSLQWKQ